MLSSETPFPNKSSFLNNQNTMIEFFLSLSTGFTFELHLLPWNSLLYRLKALWQVCQRAFCMRGKESSGGLSIHLEFSSNGG
jgi:hypothetical protein